MKLNASSPPHVAALERNAGPAPGSAASPGAGAGQAAGTPRGSLEIRFGWLVLLAVWLLSAAYMASRLRTGFIPYDAGSMGQAAERVLRGEVPHRDFFDMYTGGVDYLDALAFRFLGTNLLSLRLPLFLFFLAWVPALYFAARRFVKPLAAAGATLLCVAWSVPSYPEAMPSWYNLFFATWGTLALLRYTETENRRWLWLSGICAGLSFLAKDTASYFVAAVFLFIAFREQSLSRREPDISGKAALPYRIFATAGLALFLAVLIKLISRDPTAAGLTHFVLPSACLAALLLWSAWREPSARSVARLRRLFSMASVFLAGALIPVGLLLLWYASHGAVRALVQGTLIRPILYSRWATLAPLPPQALAGLAPLAVLLFLAYSGKGPQSRFLGPLVAAVLAIAFLAVKRSLAVYEMFSMPLPMLVPLLAPAAAYCLRSPARLAGRKREQLFLVVAVASLCAIIQFPRATANHFYYALPLVILALVALLSLLGRGDAIALGSLLVFYVALAACLHTPGFYLAVGIPARTPLELRAIALPRAGGVRTWPELAAEYEGVVKLVQAHARGAYIYAAPDSPEVYFLSGFRNPTPTFFDLYDPDYYDAPARTRRILGQIHEHQVTVIVLHVASNLWRTQSPLAMPPGLLAALDSEFPLSARVADFEVRWKP